MHPLHVTTTESLLNNSNDQTEDVTDICSPEYQALDREDVVAFFKDNLNLMVKKRLSDLQFMDSCLTCLYCNEMLTTNYEALDHFVNKHETGSFAGRWCPVYYSDDKPVTKHINFERFYFSCDICDQESLDSDSAMICSVFSSIQKSHDHWYSFHEDTSDSKFRFSVKEIVMCAKCNFVGWFSDVMQHNRNVHQEHLAVSRFLDARSCVLCPYIGDSLVQHVKDTHEYISMLSNSCLSGLENPVCLTDQSLIKLLSINVHAKKLCIGEGDQKCGFVSETRGGIRKHVFGDHFEKGATIQTFFDNESIKVIVMCCNDEIELKDLFSHFSNPDHRPNGTDVCHNCGLQASNMFYLYKHYVQCHQEWHDSTPECIYREVCGGLFHSSRVVFGNGLTLSLQNLIGTKFDFSKMFESLIEELILRDSRSSN